MSQWTHVNSCIYLSMLILPEELDGCNNDNEIIKQHVERLKKEMGQPALFKSEESVWDNCKLPIGSEGSLEYHVSLGDKWHRAIRLCIYGDLRDYNDWQKIVDFHNNIVKENFVRDGVLQIDIEGQSEKTFVYSCEKNEFVFTGELLKE